MSLIVSRSFLFILYMAFAGHSTLSYGQCKWDVNEKDKFSGKKILSSDRIFLYQEMDRGIYSDNCELEIAFENNTPTFRVRYLIEPALAKGTQVSMVKLAFRLENDEVIELSQTKNINVGIVCCYGSAVAFALSLTKEQVMSFSKYKIVGAKFICGEYEDTFEIKKKALEKILKYSTCLLSEI